MDIEKRAQELLMDAWARTDDGGEEAEAFDWSLLFSIGIDLIKACMARYNPQALAQRIQRGGILVRASVMRAVSEKTRDWPRVNRRRYVETLLLAGAAATPEELSEAARTTII